MLLNQDSVTSLLLFTISKCAECHSRINFSQWACHTKASLPYLLMNLWEHSCNNHFPFCQLMSINLGSIYVNSPLVCHLMFYSNSLPMTFHIPTTTSIITWWPVIETPFSKRGSFDANCPAKGNLSSASGSEEHCSETRPTPNYSIKFHIVFCLCCHSVKPELNWTKILVAKSLVGR